MSGTDQLNPAPWAGRQLVALISVYHKDDIVDFARALVELGFLLLASGGTAKALRAAGLAVRDVAELVGGNAILGHRVVTLSRELHAGLLAEYGNPEHVAELLGLELPWVDLVCVDLYPLEEAIADPNATRASVIEKTDIGGPTMTISGAKGRRIVVCDPADRTRVIEWLKTGRPDEDTFVTALCAKAYGMIANYHLQSARFHSDGAIDGMVGTRVLVPKYGENVWQAPAGLYAVDESDPLALHRFQPVAGQPPSYNNLCDLDRMVQTVAHIYAAFWRFQPYIAIGVKHGNPLWGIH